MPDAVICVTDRRTLLREIVAELKAASDAHDIAWPKAARKFDNMPRNSGWVPSDDPDVRDANERQGRALLRYEEHGFGSIVGLGYERIKKMAEDER